MIVFVDYEHADGRSTPWGEKVLAARTWITYRLEDLSGLPCHLVRYDHVDAGLLRRLDAKAVFISGNGTDPWRYDQQALEPLRGIVRDAAQPIFGFCGGFQCIAQTLDVPLSPISVDASTPAELLRPFGTDAAGNEKQGEAGYHPIALEADHPLVGDLGPDPVFRHAHYLQVPSLPDGFRTLASSPVTPIQMAVSDERRMVGTQFHPEYYTNEHPAGRVMIENFLRWTELLD